MITWLVLFLIVAAATALWPIGRWALAGHGKPAAMGFWASVTAAALTWGWVIAAGGPIRVGPVWAAGVFFGIAYSVGFILFIMRALQIGPVGPTVTVNNMAMVCGVVCEIVWLRPHVPGAATIAGITGVCAALVMIGVSRDNNSGAHAASARWLTYVLVGGALAGVSFITQTYVGTMQATHGRLFAAAGFLVSALVLAPAALRQGVRIRGRREPIGGLLIGACNGVVLPLTVAAIQRIGSHVVLPVTVVSPMLLMLVIGRVIYGERLPRTAWIACIIGGASIVLIAWGQAMRA